MLGLALAGVLLIFDSVLRFILLCLRALVPSSPALSTKASTAKCIILIAANNEAGTIGPTVRFLKDRQLDEDDWPIWVVADRCSDGTAAEAANAGAAVAIRQEGQLGKGAVLAWWLKQYQSEWTWQDYILVLDADSRLSPESFESLKKAMQNNVQVAQCFVAPHTVNRDGRLAGWSEVLMQRIDDEARFRCGWSVPLRGTGMLFKAPILAQLAPGLHTLAEDLELDCLLAAQGVPVTFVPQAQVLDPKPQQVAGASRQRARWLQGQFQVLRDYHFAILQALLRGKLGNWFLLCLLFLRPKIAMIAVRFGILLIALLTGQPLRMLALVMAVGLVLDVAYYLGGAAFVDEPKRYCRDLLSVPRYAAMWAYGLGLATVRRGWLRAGR